MEQNKFIKGKWYFTKSYNDDGTKKILYNTYFAKCLSFKDDIMRASELYIMNYDVCPSGYDFCRGYYWKEADMKEVSKFLPEGHVDKIITHEFETGKWYELKYLYLGKLCNTLMKSTSTSTNRLDFTEYYDIEDKRWKDACGFAIDRDIKSFSSKELSIEDVQQYLYKGHPDKIVELPEEYIVKIEDGNVKKVNEVVDYFYNDLLEPYRLTWKIIICKKGLGDIDRRQLHIPSYYNHLPVFTYEQWNKLKDMKEEFKLPKKFVINGGEFLVEFLKNNTDKNPDRYSGNITFAYYYFNNNICINVSENLNTEYTLITEEQFKKYIMKDKKIIGYKLKEDCKQFEKAAFTLSNSTDITINTWLENLKKCGFYFTNCSINRSNLETAKVLDLWFEPVYEEESITLNFGDTRVTVTKGQGYVSLQEGNITKAELKQIIDHFSKGPKMLGYEGKADKVIYGCKSGKISELKAIYEAM